MSADAGPGEGFFPTCRRVLFAPRTFFARPPTRRSRVRPVRFAVAVTALAMTASAVLTALVQGAPAATLLGRALGALLLAPFVALASLYVNAALTHAWLRIVGAKPLPFRETRDCVSYASATSLVGALPWAGPVVGVAWHLALLVIGLERTHGSPRRRVALAVVAGLAVPIMAALGLRGGFVEAFKIPAGSMVPTVQVGDHIFVNKAVYGLRVPFSDARFWQKPPRRGEVIVFRYPEQRDQDFIKRVIGLPGDRIDLQAGRPSINGWRVPSCPVGAYVYRDGGQAAQAELVVEYLEDKAYLAIYDRPLARDPLDAQGPFFVKPGEAWVLGDNRNNSHDSRSWFGGKGGGVPQIDLLGRAAFIWIHVEPGGSISFDRFFADLNGAPVLPAAQAATLRPALERCLSARPPREQTTPPPPAKAADPG